MSFQITRKGTWPILKYILRGDHGRYAVVMIDDENGDIFINPGEQVAFQHWWGVSGRGTKTLREFLVRDSQSYLEDKFSYGLERWCWCAAVKDLQKACTNAWGYDWPEAVTELLDELEGHDRGSSDLFHYLVMGCEPIIEEFGHDSYGTLSGNKYVTRFLTDKWPALVGFWKQELSSEAQNA